MTAEPAADSPPPKAVVVGVGDELLFGTTLNSNGTWLSHELSDLGLEVFRRVVVGDRTDEIADGIREALGEAEVVIVTGGLGPTPDDLTREAVAGLLGAPLLLNENLLAGLKNRSLSRGYEALPGISEAMAMVPEGGEFIENPHGAAPGLVMEDDGGRLCVLLPGIPREMRGIFRGEVNPLLRERFSTRLRPVIHRIIHTTGIPESVLSAEIAELLPRDPGPVSVAFLPDVHGVRLRLSARTAPGSTDAEEALQRIEHLLEPALSGHRYYAETGDLAEAIGHGLARANATVAVAESCTGGLMAKRITDQPGSSRYFMGGVVAYANEAKACLLGVPHELLMKHGAVSREVAESMALGVAANLGAEIGVGVTGIAGPSGGTVDRPVGTVWCAVSSAEQTVARVEIFPGDREDVRERAVQAALNLLLRVLGERRP